MLLYYVLVVGCDPVSAKFSSTHASLCGLVWIDEESPYLDCILSGIPPVVLSAVELVRTPVQLRDRELNRSPCRCSTKRLSAPSLIGERHGQAGTHHVAVEAPEGVKYFGQPMTGVKSSP